MESYKHQFAKRLVARWLADPDQRLVDFRNATGGGPFGRGVFTEYPFCLDRNDNLVGSIPWHEVGPCLPPINKGRLDEIALPGTTGDWNAHPPTYDQCLLMGLEPLVIFDVALHHKGMIAHAFEIVHTNDISDDKLMHIHRIQYETGLSAVYGLSAEWVLSQVKRPSKLQPLWTI